MNRLNSNPREGARRMGEDRHKGSNNKNTKAGSACTYDVGHTGSAAPTGAEVPVKDAESAAVAVATDVGREGGKNENELVEVKIGGMSEWVGVGAGPATAAVAAVAGAAVELRTSQQPQTIDGGTTVNTTHSRAHTSTHSHICTYTHTHRHTCKHTHTHMQAHTHTHTHTTNLLVSDALSDIPGADIAWTMAACENKDGVGVGAGASLGTTGRV